MMKIHIGEGKIYFDAKVSSFKDSVSYLIEQYYPAFDEDEFIMKNEFYIAFASRGFFESLQILNIY